MFSVSFTSLFARVIDRKSDGISKCYIIEVYVYVLYVLIIMSGMY